MKLYEFFHGTTTKSNHPDYPDGNIKLDSIYKGREIWCSSEFSGRSSFGLRDQAGKSLSFVQISSTRDNGYYHFIETGTQETHRRQGLARFILQYLLQNRQLILMVKPVDILTNNGRDFLYNCLIKGYVKPYDLHQQPISIEQACTILQDGKYNNEGFLIGEID